MSEQQFAQPSVQKKSQAVQSQVKQVQPKLKFRDQMSFVHSCYKLMPQKMLKNTSWQKDVVMADYIEHGHYYHSHTNYGVKNDACAPVGGHFHYVEVYVDSDGTMRGKCSPPKKKILEKLPNGTSRTKIVDIKHYDKNEDKSYADNHTHEVVYLWSNEISMAAANQSMVKTAQLEQAKQTKSFENSEVKLDVQD